jgi:hypothetical protein
MHYIGMAALMLDGSIIWDRRIVGLSVVIAVWPPARRCGWLSACGIRQRGLYRSHSRGLGHGCRHLCDALYRHECRAFQEMAHTLPGGIGELGLSIWVSVTTLCLLGVMLIISLIDSHRRTSRLTDNLHNSTASLSSRRALMRSPGSQTAIRWISACRTAAQRAAEQEAICRYFPERRSLQTRQRYLGSQRR